MKKLSLLYKKLPFINVAWFGISFILLSCDLSDNIQLFNSSETVSVSPQLEPAKPSFFKPRYVYLKSQGAELAHFDPSACKDSSVIAVELIASLSSVFGSSETHLIIPKNKLEHKPVLQWEGMRAYLDLDGENMVKELCSANVVDDQIEVTADFISHMYDGLSSASTDCKFHLQQNGWNCQLKVADNFSLDELSRKFEEKKTYLLKKWMRQPYLVSRRLTVAKDLISALKENSSPVALDNFCRVSKESLRAELPLLLSVEKWQTNLCQGAFEDRQKFGKYMVTKTLDEFDYILNMTQKTNVHGYLTFRYAENLTENQNLWVTLSAGEDVKNSILASSKLIWKEMGVENPDPNQDSQQVQMCWHPGLEGKDEAFWLSQYLGILGHSPRAKCEPVGNNKTLVSHSLDQFQSYILSAITAETAFVVSNGVIKVLDLPKGAYNYSIYRMPKNLSNLNNWKPMKEDLIDQGVLSWNESKPHVNISKRI